MGCLVLSGLGTQGDQEKQGAMDTFPWISYLWKGGFKQLACCSSRRAACLVD